MKLDHPEAVSYEESLAVLLHKYLTDVSNRDTLVVLLTTLGCRCVAGMLGDNPRKITPEQPDAKHEKLVSGTLRRLICLQISSVYRIESENAFALLDGLSKNNRWKQCLDDEDTALKFATLVVDYFDSIPNSFEGRLLRATVSPDICAMLNAWLTPSDLFVTYPDPEAPSINDPKIISLVHALFGDVWCALFLNGRDDQAWEIPDIIRAQRPSLQPHLVAFECHQRAEPLPTLEAP